MRPLLRTAAAFCFAVLIAPAAHPQEMPADMKAQDMPARKPVVPAGPLKISFGDKTSEWTPQSFAALPHVTVNVYNEHAKANQTYSGVPLIALLKPLGVPDKPHGKDFRLYLVAEGSDGYQVVYSVAEVTPDVHDATILVADSMDGKPMGDNGPLQLVATGEKRPARWVRNLVAIRVMTAQ
ncbi:MAG TPA: molybdopterin-dependent oxidoreductase [Terracidiphilus sp.]|nr:molybdopterin-dependent oxidoreductase [Terracidiphilus sp.]